MTKWSVLENLGQFRRMPVYRGAGSGRFPCLVDTCVHTCMRVGHLHSAYIQLLYVNAYPAILYFLVNVRTLYLCSDTSLIHHNWECQFHGGLVGLAD